MTVDLIAPPARGVLTDLLLDHLSAALAPQSILVGDHEHHADAGWTGAEPGRGDYRAHTVLSTGVAAPIRSQPETLASMHSSWLCAYSLVCYGSSRQQADWCADQVRTAAVGFGSSPQVLDLGGDWTLQQVVFGQLAPVSRNDEMKPPEWSLREEAQLWLSRGTRRR